ncbi:GNAT family N-acetyltransferase [Bradyrhizobium oligotrophicum]|uniref:GNAT family N-acetyltransferase n=1 Tax=Bradyrhizobium oligotrophicum TaxID=44255 RepID=UPI0009FFA078|nr:GNAT family N-acetyltransferase [Bradyrhizobium oligotrophicum]
MSIAYDSDEPERVSALFRTIVDALPYYNERAKASAISNYSAGRLRQSASTDSSSILVARFDTSLVGFAISNLDDETIWLSWFGVDPVYRRRGIGDRLLQALDQRALLTGTHKLWCDSRTDNAESKAILAGNGFRQICTIPDHWYRQDFILWEKRVG